MGFRNLGTLAAQRDHDRQLSMTRLDQVGGSGRHHVEKQADWGKPENYGGVIVTMGSVLFG